MRRVLSISWLVAVSAWSCVPTTVGPGAGCFACLTDSECGPSFVCQRRVCVHPDDADACRSTLVPASLTPSRGWPGMVVTLRCDELDDVTGVSLGGTKALVLDRTAGVLQLLVMSGTSSGPVELLAPSGALPTTATFTRVATPVPTLRTGAMLRADGLIGYTYFGGAVASNADGRRVLLGSQEHDASRGGAWTFARPNDSWTQEGGALMGQETNATGQGFWVSLDALGNTAATGSYGNSMALPGGAFVYERQADGGWEQQGSKFLSSPVEAMHGPFEGASVSLSADGRLLFSAVINPQAPAPLGLLFTRDSTGWNPAPTELHLDTPGLVTRNGGGLSADGTVAMLVADQGYSGNGSAWVFEKGAGGWKSGFRLEPVDRTAVGGMSSFAALSGDGQTVLLAGTRPLADNALGCAVWAFTRSSNGAWSQHGPRVDVPDTIRCAQWRPMAAINFDGSWFVSAGSSEGNTSNSAVVYVKTSSGWELSGERVTFGTVGATGHGWYGTSLGISHDGQTVLGGSPGDYAAWVLASD